MNQIINESKHLLAEGDSSIHDGMKRELEIIQSKKAAAESELKALDTKRAELEQWLRDLAVTERTLARMLDVDLPDDTATPLSEHSRRKKPEHIPSVYDMAVTVLREYGVEFVEGQDIVIGIKTRWWPSATNNDILPTLWRLAIKDQRLRKEGTKYALPIRAALRDTLRPPVSAAAQ